ncbi:MAG: hypothetical protein ACLFWL_03995 [Candidatus Brocadiia bacterium]
MSIFRVTFTLFLVFCSFTHAAEQNDTLVLDNPETAGISGTRWFWDLPVVLSADGKTADYSYGKALKSKQAVWCNLDYHGGYAEYRIPKHMKNAEGKRVPWKLQSVVGATCFDAVHRRVLVRFPGAARKIVDKMKQGWRVEKAELHLPFRDTEKVPRAYKGPSSFLRNGGMWDKIRPRWHAVAWALRRPWKADPEIGPTFNAYVNGAGYWAKYGARDTEKDRFPARFGPAEISHKRTEPLDVTKVLTGKSYGKTPGERFRLIADNGFIVKKLEYYDHRFANPGYEWGTMTGGRGIFIGTPKLVVTFQKAEGAKPGKVPSPADIPALAEKLENSDRGGEPTLQLPDKEEYEKLYAEYGFQRPEDMPDWQWKRVRELYRLGGRANALPETLKGYKDWIDGMLATQPRRWEGFKAADQLSIVYKYRDALPPYVVDHWHLYWKSWMMCHRETHELVHPQYHQIWTKYRNMGTDYYDRTGDWRGNYSFYRAGYTRIISTMNFNHTAATGALLGGAFRGCDRAIRDGRYGLEHFPLRLWAWFEGSTQESIDHYYLSHTLHGQKAFADLGPTRFDRMMGRSIMAKNVDELVNCYHPGLRRFISTALRTTPFYALQIQEGVQHIVHTLSREGALTDLDRAGKQKARMRKKEVNVFPITGHDLPPRRVALQAINQPWGPEWMANVVDQKPLPYSITSTWKQWGAFIDYPKWKKSHMGHHYGVASFDLNSSPTINLMGMWKRTEKSASSAEHLRMLMVRYGYNRTNFIDTHKGGTLGQMGGGLGVLQHKGKLLIASSPHANLKSSHYKPQKQKIKSLQTSACLFNIQNEPTWKLYANGKPVEKLPARYPTDTRITLHDGVSYVGVIPLKATDLGRNAEIIIKKGGEPVRTQTGAYAREALLIENYNYRSDQAFNQNRNDWDPVDLAYGGFVVELGDVEEYGGFKAFQKHIRSARLEQRWDANAETLHLDYRSGEDRMEMGFRPRGADTGKRTSPKQHFPYRRVNGKWPYLEDGIERDSTLTVQGRAPELRKNGAVLRTEPGRMAMLQTEPTSGTFVAWNPLPDPTHFALETPGEIRIEADGRVSMMSATVRPAESTVAIRYAVKPGQESDDMATALFAQGFKQKPSVTLNERSVETLQKITVARQSGWIIPLNADGKTAPDIENRIKTAREKLTDGRTRRLDEKAVMRYENTQEHYLLTEPQSGYFEFQRLWPGPTALEASVADTMVLATDGRLALRRLVMSPGDNVVIIDAPSFMQHPRGQFPDHKATAALIHSPNGAPEVTVNGQKVKGKMPEAKIDGKTYHVVPLFEESPEKVLKDLKNRYRSAQKLLPGT